MKKAIIKAAVLLMAFVASIIISGMNTNGEGANLTSEMAQAEFPIMEIYYKNHEMAELHGYAKPMEYTSMRDNLVAVHSDRDLVVRVKTFAREIESINYQIRSLDGSHLVSEGSLDCGDTLTDELSLDFHVENMLEPDEEYQLCFAMDESGRDIFYYTRLMKTDNEELDTYLDFISDFHKRCFNDSWAEKLAVYIEPNGAIMANNDYSYSTINSSLSHLSYGSWKPTEVGNPNVSICEFNNQYGVFKVDYILTSVGTGGEQEYYNAREYYRVGYNDERMRCSLYDFEREINQIFRADGNNYTDRDVILGIRDNNITYAKSENGRIICFVQEGELWSINETNNYLTKIFSFRGYEGIDPRENFGAHDIKIISVEEGGSVNFAVYGYMNRGVHEGQVGIQICRFDAMQSTVEEIVFIESDTSYSRLFADMDNVLFAGNTGTVYVMNQGNLYGISPANYEVTAMATGLTKDRYIYNEEYHILAWQDEAGGDIDILNMASGRKRVITAGAGEYLRLVDYLDDDLIYGVENTDSPKQINGNRPFSKVVIYSSTAGSQMKSYEKEGVYISDISVETYALVLNRVVYSQATGYCAIDDDTIMNKKGEGILDKNISRLKDDNKQYLVTLSLYSNNSEREYNLVTSQEIITEPHVVVLDMEPTENYYVYAKGELMEYFSSLSDAVLFADANRGVVVDKNLKEVWSRAKEDVHNAIKLTVDENMIDVTPDSLLENMYPDASRYELRNVSLYQILYYISKDIPVIAHKNTGDVLITGYDNNIVRVVDIITGDSGNQYQDTFDEEMKSTGGRYSVYVK